MLKLKLTFLLCVQFDRYRKLELALAAATR
jgi:hypothetical protein